MIAVTNDINTIKIDDGNTIIDVGKKKVKVSAYQDNVYLSWDGYIWINSNYANFSAPSGASAIIVRDAIAVFLNTVGGGTLNAITKSYTIGVPGTTGVDYNFTSVGNALEQSRQLGASAIIPANSPIISIVVKCTEAIEAGGATTAINDVGDTLGGDEWISTIALETLNQIASVSTWVAAKAAASSIYFSITPGVTWNTLTAGKWKIWISYFKNDTN